MHSASLGVKLFMSVDFYQKSMRAIKYVMLFILLTFLSVFLFEIFGKKQVHPIQYLLVGFAMTIFYLLLIAISEHSYFFLAYIVAAIAIVLLITGYTVKILGARNKGLTMGSIIALLYGYLYILLINQDYALLIGSIGLFGILAFVMYITRNLDWYQIGSDTGSDS